MRDLPLLGLPEPARPERSVERPSVRFETGELCVPVFCQSCGREKDIPVQAAYRTCPCGGRVWGTTPPVGRKGRGTNVMFFEAAVRAAIPSLRGDR